jgi:hypothetical protein
MKIYFFSALLRGSAAFGGDVRDLCAKSLENIARQ